MAQAPIAQASATTNTQAGSLVTVQGNAPIKITFRFVAAEQTGLLLNLGNLGFISKKLSGMPIVVGKLVGNNLQSLTNAPLKIQALGAPVTKQMKLDGHTANIETSTFELPAVAQGTTVALYWAVDVKQKFRKFPLYQVTAGANDIVLDIFEYPGQHGLNDTAQLTETVTLANGKKVDYYVGKLTGDVWMRSAHPFTVADVDALQEPEQIKSALRNIYTTNFINIGSNFAIDVTNQAGQRTQLLWISSENGNCLNNISNYNLRRDVPSRINPAAYAAVANAALKSGVSVVQFTSSWRPMLGSSGHRLGRGLDIKWLDNLQLNRAALIQGGSSATVTAEERQLFNAHKAAELTAKHKVTASVNIKKSANATPAQKQAAQAEADAAESNARTAKKSWTDKMESNQSGKVRDFRSELMHINIVKQILDPWYWDKNTHDAIPMIPNEMEPGDPKNHNNHLHLTITDTELG